jgi:DHA2 family lincomycin resistance protein-like MFS transporter
MAGFGFMITPLMAESLGVLPNRLYSHGSAILSTIQQLAGAFGTAVVISVATLASTDPARAPDANGMHTAFLTAGFVGVLTLLASLFVRSVPATGDADS